MKNTIRKFVLANAIAFSLMGVGSSFAASDSKPADSVGMQVADARREGQIWTSYAVNPHLRALDISVKVEGTNAMLSGKVENSVEKDLAEQIALGVDGIKHVDNRLAVDNNYVPTRRGSNERNFGDKVGDATITATVKSKLLWNSNTDGLDIHVETDNGKVTLSGNANSSAEKDLAGRIAHNTNGVTGVNNRIAMGGTSSTGSNAKAEVKTAARETGEAVSDSWITTKVKSTLLFSRNVDGLDIGVTTSNGVVSLSGVVDTPAQRELAKELAQNVRGVKKVDARGLKAG
jgi:hyperosmotically inducible periplasmic protein